MRTTSAPLKLRRWLHRVDEFVNCEREFVLKTHIASMALLALGLSAGVNAHASSAQLTISNLQVRLIDLDLSDGITPALSLNASFTSLVAGGQTTSATSIEAPLGPLTVVNGSSTWSAQSFGGSLLTTPGWSATALTSGTSGLHTSSTTVSMTSPRVKGENPFRDRREALARALAAAVTRRTGGSPPRPHGARRRR